MTEVAIPLPYVAKSQHRHRQQVPLLYEKSSPLILLVPPLDAVVYGFTLRDPITKGIAMNACDPGHNEYLAAISHLHEQTPSPKHEPAVGDFVSGTTEGKRWSGHVEWVADDGLMCIRGDGWWAYVPVKDITH